MRSIYFRNLTKNVQKNWKRVVISAVCFGLIFGFLGCIVYSSYPSEVSDEEMNKIEEYEEILQEYDDAIADLEDSISTTEEQVKLFKAYCDDSVYMKIDPQKIYVSSVQYVVQNCSSVGTVMSAWTLYINEGGLKADIIEAGLTDIEEEYLKELITCSVNNNALNISVIHYDEGQARTILNKIAEQIEKYSSTIAIVEGEFSLVELGRSDYVKMDSTVMNNQNAVLNNYKTNQNSLSNLKKSLADQKSNRKNYIEYNKPEELNTEKSRMIILKYVIFGAIFGLGLPLLFMVLRYILSDRLKGHEDLLAAELPVIGTYRNGKDYEPELNRSLLELEWLIKDRDTENIFLNIVNEDEFSDRVAADYENGLREQSHAEVIRGTQVEQNAELLKRMIAIGACVLIVEAGRTTYRQIEEQVQLCRKFHVDLLGCVVIE